MKVTDYHKKVPHYHLSLSLFSFESTFDTVELKKYCIISQTEGNTLVQPFGFHISKFKRPFLKAPINSENYLDK